MNRWADQSANGFSCSGNACKTPALILAFNLCDSRKIIRSSLIRVAGWPSSRQASFSFRRVLPPGLLRPSRHEPHGGDERVEQAGVVALARPLAQVLVERIGVTAQQIGGGGYAEPTKIGGDGWADVGDVFQGGDILSSSGLASSPASGWPLHLPCSPLSWPGRPVAHFTGQAVVSPHAPCNNSNGFSRRVEGSFSR